MSLRLGFVPNFAHISWFTLGVNREAQFSGTGYLSAISFLFNKSNSAANFPSIILANWLEMGGPFSKDTTRASSIEVKRASFSRNMLS